MWPFPHKNTEQELSEAQSYVEQERYSGLTRHYDARGVQDCVKQATGVSVSSNEVTTIVNTVRQQNGWGPAEHL